MVKKAFIFPGQGAQFVGMAEDLYGAVAASREVFEEAQSLVDFDLIGACFCGPAAALSLTGISQPAILTASIAVLKAMQSSGLDLKPDYTAGLSLGEYSALVAAESLSFTDALSLVARRGKFMQEASILNPGGMVSILGLDPDIICQITEKTGAFVANLNCPGQVVVAGGTTALERVRVLAQEAGAKKVLPLNVSGPFHTPLMREAGNKLKNELDKTELKAPVCKVIFNVTARPDFAVENIKNNLYMQISQTTYWQKSVEHMIARGVSVFFEIGPGQVLKGLLKRINPEITVYNLASLEDMEKTRKALKI